jgi:hypothetical protein
MIFLTTEKGGEEGVFLLLTEADLQTLRRGQTLSVDRRCQGLDAGFNAKRVDLGYAPTQEKALEMIRAAGHRLGPEGMVGPKAAPDEVVCEGCSAILPYDRLNQGRCIVCWRTMAIRRMGEDN